MTLPKRLHTIPLLTATLLALGACAAPPMQQPPPPASAAGCDASKAQFALGQEPTVALQDLARQRSGARIVRTLRPGQAVTMEYSAERLNLALDAGARVVRVTCG